MNKSEKGFTLIELLVVLALVAILSVVVILTLNPAELLKQARDSNRTSDLSTLKSAISLFMADVNVTPTSLGAAGTCYYSYVATTATVGCGGAFPTSTTNGTTTYAGVRNINGTGWIPVNFSAISSGAPIGQLPVDPVNTSAFYYTYGVGTSSNQLFEIDAKMESTKYSTTGGSELLTSDGGNNNGWYETGTTLSL